MIYAVDGSNYTSKLSIQSVRCWIEKGVDRMIVQAINPPPRYPPSETVAQLQVCAEAGLRTDAYVYLWWALGISDIIGKLRLLDGFRIGRLWLDVEDTPSGKSPDVLAATISSALSVLGGYPAAQPPGLYTGKWWWDKYMRAPGSFLFSEMGVPLWPAQYDNTPDFNVFTPFGGWTSCAYKQYVGSTSLCGVSGIDLSVVNPAYDLPVDLPVPGGTNVIVVGEGMKAQMDASGDAPWCGHRQYDETDDDGSTHKVEECFGSKGLYVSSNATGQWINAGPF